VDVVLCESESHGIEGILVDRLGRVRVKKASKWSRMYGNSALAQISDRKEVCEQRTGG